MTDIGRRRIIGANEKDMGSAVVSGRRKKGREEGQKSCICVCVHDKANRASRQASRAASGLVAEEQLISVGLSGARCSRDDRDVVCDPRNESE